MLILKYLSVETSFSIYLPLHSVTTALRRDNPTETQSFIIRPWLLLLSETLHVQWKLLCGWESPFHLKHHPVWINMVNFQSNNLQLQAAFQFSFDFYHSSLTLLSSAMLTCRFAWFFAWEEVLTAANQSFISSFNKTHYQRHVKRIRHYELVWKVDVPCKRLFSWMQCFSLSLQWRHSLFFPAKFSILARHLGNVLRSYWTWKKLLFLIFTMLSFLQENIFISFHREFKTRINALLNTHFVQFSITILIKPFERFFSGPLVRAASIYRFTCRKK